MVISVTGSQKANHQSYQAMTLKEVFKLLDISELHHGDCIGWDEICHDKITFLNPDVRTVIHPPDNPSKRAFCKGTVILPEKPYLERNRDIAAAGQLLIAGPHEFKEELRSGTWATVRYARKLEKPIIIIWPDGSTSEERLLELTDNALLFDLFGFLLRTPKKKL